MRVCFIVAGMDKRIDCMNRCIQCLADSKYAGWDTFCYWQGSRFGDVVGREIFKEVIIDPNPRGVFTPRYELMKRFALDYDYTIIIDDDLYMGKDTHYEKTIAFMESVAGRTVGACTTQNYPQYLKNKVNIIGLDDGINVQGGLVIRKVCVQEIVDYFREKQADYTFDCFWLLLWIKGWDLARDFRSYSCHSATVKIGGEYTGFNEMSVSLPYVPFLPEYLEEPPIVYRHGRYERDIPGMRQLNARAFSERKRCRKERGFAG